MLTEGTKLGPYEILSPLGAGGMGEVYRARDLRLDRDVAIKVLPSHLTMNVEFKQRFEREARSISQLSHPNICTLHDIGNEDGVDFLVMELFEGETLAQRLNKGHLPLEDVLRFGIEISSALDKAHRAGIVHRDLKPGNIMLTKSGAKLLDFGLAKTAPGHSGLSTAPDAATLTESLTAKGTILGTVQYMAPEQLEGEEADSRTDIFAFGAVLYEMATGHRAFEGKSRVSLMASIMSAQPRAISEFRPMTPPALDFLVKVCLAKDPDERIQTAFDVGIQLRWATDSTSAQTIPLRRGSKRRRREAVAWSVACVALLALAWMSSLMRSQHAEQKQVVKSTIPAPDDTYFEFIGTGVDGAGPPALSPGGTHLAFTASNSQGEDLLWIRPLNTLIAKPISGTRGARYPFWAPDGLSVGFFADGSLNRVEMGAEIVQPICSAPNGRGGAWNRDNMIVFAPDSWGPLHSVSARGGSSTPVTPFVASEEETHRWPSFLPDGEHFLFLNRLTAEAQTRGRNAIFVGSLTENVKHHVVNASGNPILASGHLLTENQGVLFAQEFDSERLELIGESVPIATGVSHDAEYVYGIFTASQNGMLAYQPSGDEAGFRLNWVARNGEALGTVGAVEKYFRVALGPSGQRVAVTVADPASGWTDVWIYDLERNVRSRGTLHGADDYWPVWLADGKSFYFSSERGGHHGIYKKQLDDPDVVSVYQSEKMTTFATDCTSDGRFVIFQTDADPRTTQSDIFTLSIEDDSEIKPFSATRFDERQAAFSPDDQWVAFTSDESGRTEVYCAPFSRPGAKRQISLHGGSQPRWNGDGTELYYISPDRRMMAVAIKLIDTELASGKSEALFEIASNRNWDAYDVAPDGQRFLINTPLPRQASTPIVLVSNWLDVVNPD